MNKTNRNIISSFDNLSTDEILDTCYKNAYLYDVMALNVHGDMNIGNMIRTANLCGCREFIIFGRNKYDKRSCVGSNNYVVIKRICGNELSDRLTDEDYFLDEQLFIDFVIENNYVLIFIEQDTNSIKCTDSNMKKILTDIKKINKIPLFVYVFTRIGS